MKASVSSEIAQNDVYGLLVNLTCKITLWSASLCALNNENSFLKFQLVLTTKHLFSLVMYTILLSVTFGPVKKSSKRFIIVIYFWYLKKNLATHSIFLKFLVQVDKISFANTAFSPFRNTQDIFILCIVIKRKVNSFAR